MIPTPLDDRDRDGGYWELSMRQVEVWRTMVFDAPRRARAFFEAMVRDNLGIGRPDQVELIFTGRCVPPDQNTIARPHAGQDRRGGATFRPAAA